MNETYSNVLTKLGIYIENDVNEDNLGLNLINDARHDISRMKVWHHMLKHTTLTLTDKSTALPSDILDLRIYALNEDSDGDLYPDVGSDFFYMANWEDGFEFIPSGDKDNGFSYTMRFYNPPITSIHCVYQHKLEDFTGTGTEYLLFPGSLVIKYALWNHFSKEGMTNNDVSHLWKNFEKELDGYVSSVQNVNVKRQQKTLDDIGGQISISPFNLSSGRNRYHTNYGNNWRKRII